MPDEDFEIPTPFGKINLQPPSIPSLEPPDLDDRKMDAMKHAIASDIATIVGFIPVIGDIVADVVEDLHGAELRKILSPDEMNEYSRQDKVSPSTIALIRTFSKQKP